MILLFLQIIYYLLPAYVATMVPVLVVRLNFLGTSIDFGRTFRGKRIFGDHKTFRGFLFGTGAGVLVCYLQYVIGSPLAVVDYSYWLLFGFLNAFGSLVGDSIKSFFKRQIGIPPGKSFFPFDQLDYSIGAFLFTFAYVPSWSFVLWGILLSFFLHLITTALGYTLKLKKQIL